MILFKNSFITLILGISLSLFVNISAASNKEGPTAVGKTGSSGNPVINNGADCNLCHGASIPGIAPDVSIEGPVIVAPKIKYTYKLTMTGGQNNLSGINVSVDSGTLFNGGLGTLVDSNTGEIKHLEAKVVMLDSTTVTWLIDWVAPATPGTSTIYASLLSANGDTTTDKDKSTKLSLPIEVVDPAITTAPVIPEPNIEIFAPFRARIGTQVNFFAIKALNSPVGSFAKSYTWKVNIDNNILVKEGEQVDFSFPSIGNYTINLSTLSNSTSGKTSNTFFDIEIVDLAQNIKLIPKAKITPPSIVVVNSEVTFSGATSTPTTISQYYWDFGDNTPDPVANPGAEMKYTFTTTGKHFVTLAVQDLDINGGFVGIDTIEVNVVEAPVSGGGNQATTGLSLYNSNCNSCHGAAGIGGSAKNIQGATVVLVDRTLINGTHPAITITPVSGTQLIASYLGSGADSLNGLSLYTNRCLLCHGVEGIGVAGLGKRVQGVSKILIERAINSQNINTTPPPISLMKGIKLTTAEVTLIESYLATVVPVANALTGKSIFISNCQMCHGTGDGGHAKTITGFSETQISNAILNIQSMNTAKLLSLQVIDKKDLTAYLAGPTYIPRPTTGPGLFEMYCSYCHGADGTGAVIATKPIKAKGFDEKKIRDAYGENGIKVMRKSNLPNVNLTKIERQNIAIFLDPTVANGGN